MFFFLLYLIVGAFAGLLAGLFGVGGGMIIVPALIFSFMAHNVSVDILTHMAVATSLATIVFTSLSSVWAHHRKGAVLWPLARLMLIGLVIGTLLGVTMITSVPGLVLQRLIGLFSLLLAIKMLLQWQPEGKARNPNPLVLNSISGLIGFGSSWFGIGGGSFVVPYLTWLGINMRQAVATSAVCGIPIALSATLSNMVAGWEHPDLPQWSTGYVYWPAVMGISLASVPFARLGAKLAHRLDSELLKKLFAVLLCVVGVRFLFF